eukprot:s1800_g10.t1
MCWNFLLNFGAAHFPFVGLKRWLGKRTSSLVDDFSVKMAMQAQKAKGMADSLTARGPENSIWTTMETLGKRKKQLILELQSLREAYARKIAETELKYEKKLSEVEDRDFINRKDEAQKWLQQKKGEVTQIRAGMVVMQALFEQRKRKFIAQMEEDKAQNERLRVEMERRMAEAEEETWENNGKTLQIFPAMASNNRQIRNRKPQRSWQRRLKIDVSLPSGRGETVSVLESATVVDLKIAAQQSLGQRFLRLASPDGHALDPADRLYGLQNGDSLAAIALQPKIAATCRAFALWVVGGDKIVTWGHPDHGGDSSKVHDQLRSVQQVCSTEGAFAAVLADGTVVTWGDPNCGGDCSRVQDRLRSVQQIYATHHAFAAILEDRSVVTWGHAHRGGDSSTVQEQLRNVQQICGTWGAFAAILADGTVVTWGSSECGGDISRVQDQLRNVQQISATVFACAAILADGTVVTWGFPAHGGDSSGVQDRLRNVQEIHGGPIGFLAFLADGTVVTWGRQTTQTSDKGFAAVCLACARWGGPNCCGDSRLHHQLRTVLNSNQIYAICATDSAVAVLLEDGHVVTNGDSNCDGDSDSSRVPDRLRNVQQIYATKHAFAAILANGTVVTWGNPECGGDSSTVQDQFSYV